MILIVIEVQLTENVTLVSGVHVLTGQLYTLC